MDRRTTRLGGISGALRPLVLLLATLGCGAAPTPPAVVASGNVNPTATAGASTVLVGWGVVRSSPGCFFFSGPGDLGRDDHLGALASLAVGSASGQLVFDGDLA